MTAGYSGTPLVRKLGIKPGMRMAVLDPPADYWRLLEDLPADLEVQDLPADPVGAGAGNLDFIHVFVRDRDRLSTLLGGLRDRIQPAGAVWVSWPKKASGVRSDVTEDVVRAEALEVGLVDVKVCAVDETWSGLKLVIPLKQRR